MAGLSRDTELRLAPEVEFSLRGDRLWLRAGGSSVKVRASLLPVLDLFREPLRLEEVMERIPAATALDWVELSAEIFALHEEGVLVGTHVRAKAQPFVSPGMHIAMLQDEVRTKTYVEAIRASVKQGDVVVEIGCGSGILSVAAAQAGARRVYAIERTGVADLAAEVFAANGVADRVTLIRNKSTAVDLPERAHLLISEIVGNDPFAEYILDYTRDAIDRMLVQRPRVLPRALRVFLVPVALPRDLRAKHAFLPESAARWRKSYGVDLSPLATHRMPTSRMVLLPLADAARLDARGDAVRVCDIDLARPPARIDAPATLPVATAGRVDGLMVHFEIDLAEGFVVSNNPRSSRAATSWKLPVWLLPQSRIYGATDEIRTRYEFTGVTPRLNILEPVSTG